MPRPDGFSLRELERRARRSGTGLADPDPASGGLRAVHPLTGTWILEQLWSARGDQSNPFTAAILRSLGATLQVGDRAADGSFPLRNRVCLGQLALAFDGRAVLSGRRPLLLFAFERLTLSFGLHPLWQHSLTAGPVPLTLQGARRQPFFALIACDRDQGWMAARGRGGGLALWGLQPQGTP
ncbi:MAG: hypothetical protein ACKOCM_04025 [Cyanobacteriota bacterium]